MQRKALCAAIAAVVTAGPAHALLPQSNTPDYRVVVSGATAPKDTLLAVIRTQICDAGTVDSFSNGTHDAIFCTVSNKAATATLPAISGLPGSRKILFLKNNGGSGTGAGAVQNNLGVDVYVPTSSANCLASGANNYISCTGSLTKIAPDWGISDVEPTIFVDQLAPPSSEGGPYVPGGPALVGINAGDPPVSLPGLGFGAVVTRSMYMALQHVQFPASSACNPAPNGGGDDVKTAKRTDEDNDGTPDGLVNGADGIKDAYQVKASDVTTPPAERVGGPHRKGDTRECMPNLAKDEFAAMLAGDVPTLSELTVSGGNDLQTANAGFPWETSDGNLYVCRRRSGSGTHAQTSIFFLRTQCDVNGRTMATQIELPGQLFEAISSGNLDNCLTAVDLGDATSSSSIVPNVPSSDGKRYGIGYQSVEKNSDFSGSYRFIKIDGRAPTLQEMHAGNYLNFGELTMQKRAPEAYNQVPASDTAAVSRMFARVAIAMSDPAGVVALNNLGLFQHPFGQAGFLIAPDPFGSPARVPEATLNLANPIGTFLHRDVVSGSTATNSCLPPRKGLPFVTPIPVDN